MNVINLYFIVGMLKKLCYFYDCGINFFLYLYEKMYRLVFCASEVKTLYHTINFVQTYGFCALSSAFCESNSIIENVFLYLYMYFFFINNAETQII